tara:strand:+ start:1364 stop:1795 length:432 start_codon:yes stop_codon:yes gene_type:complete
MAKEGMITKKRAVHRLKGKRRADEAGIKRRLDEDQKSNREKSKAHREKTDDLRREYKLAPDDSLVADVERRMGEESKFAGEKTRLDSEAIAERQKLDAEPLYKRGGKVKKKKKLKYAYGGKIRGAGCARQGVRKAKMVKMKGA